MYFTFERINKILNELKGYIYPDSEPVKPFKMKPGNFRSREQAHSAGTEWKSFEPGDKWGGLCQHFWFSTRVTIPQRFAGKTVVLDAITDKKDGWDLVNPQFMAYVNGELVQALDTNHRNILLAESAQGGEAYDIDLNAYAGRQDSMMELLCNISVLHTGVRRLYYNIKTPHEGAALLDEHDKRRIDILNYLNNAINLLDLRIPLSREFDESVDAANEYLETEFYGTYCGYSEIIANCVGHSHLDVAWGWTVAETREKAVRTFSNMLNMMKQYPEFIYMSSQPQLYKFVKEDYPDIYEQVKQRIAEGRWEPEGAMWLEADCNLTSGESLIRQLMFGKRFFKEEFGVDSKVLWLPDVFGYSWALPQILKKCGVDYFMTTKISWNEYNKLPCDTFLWKGIDGTEIFTYLIKAYNGIITPGQFDGEWKQHCQKGINNELLISYGFGDGGGGPTSEMMEYGRRLAKGIPGCAKFRPRKVLDFFKSLERRVINNPRLPTWEGELYLEHHRGTYTSMARNKKCNRRSEFLYQDAEWLSVMNNLAAGGEVYPQDKINSGWETILLNQFHDILPGSSIKEVYDDAKEDYTRVIDAGAEIVGDALSAITAKINLNQASLVVFNQLGFDRSDMVAFDLPDGWDGMEVYDNEDNLLVSQTVDEELNGTSIKKAVFYAPNVPAKGYKAFMVKKASFAPGCANTPMSISTTALSNRYFDIKLDNCSNIISIFDKLNGREVLKPGERANVIQAFEDKPLEFAAWDINIYYQEKMWEISDVESVEIVEAGPVRAALRIRRRFLNSVITQDICIYDNVPRIDFKTVIDWKQKQVLVKAAFPVDVHTTKATYEIQYGNVERPTHWNTSWDMAKFEVYAHKWADLSEDGYGVSMLNDCKYGHDIKDGVMRLTLLKSSGGWPYPEADNELHEFTYSVFPHAGDWKAAGTVNMAYNLNCPLYARLEEAHPGELPGEFSMFRINRQNVVAEVVKKAEDSGDIIVRVYECFNRRTKAQLAFFKDLEEVWECDLLENNLSDIPAVNGTFDFTIKPYEIKTFKLRVK